LTASAGKSIHVVSAWASTSPGLGQLQVDSKSNEITAILKLLELLDIAGVLLRLQWDVRKKSPPR